MSVNFCKQLKKLFVLKSLLTKLTLTTELKQLLLLTKITTAQEVRAPILENQLALLQEDLRTEEAHLLQTEEVRLQIAEIHPLPTEEALLHATETTEGLRNLNSQTAEKVVFLISLDLAEKALLLLQAREEEDLLQLEATTLTAFLVSQKTKEVLVSAG